MNKSTLRFLVLIVATLTTALVLACDDELIDDATFRLWCLDSLCSWKLEAGRVQPAPTWHKDDYGVELVDTPTIISQDLKKSAKCLVFTTVADVEASAKVMMGIDFTGDGVPDYEHPIAATGFREVTTAVTSPRTNTTPRIFISKKGHGRAVLAEIRLRSGDGCGAPPVVVRDRPLGDACTLGVEGECKSGVCCEGVCAECCLDSGNASPKRVYAAIDPAGELTFAPAVTCADGAVCERREVEQSALFVTAIPLQCNPGRRLRAPGAPCLGDDDCVSGTCDGATSSASRAPNLAEPDASTVCTGADFPDASASDCKFTRVSEGHCR